MKTTLISIAVFLILLVSTFASTSTIPYRVSFESTITNITDWQGISTPTTSTIQTVKFIEGTRSLSFNDSLTIEFDDNTATNVWIQVYTIANPSPSAPTSLPADSVGGFTFNTNGELLAYNETNWIVCNNAIVDSNKWISIATHLDYSIGKYDLYIATNGIYNERMVRAHSTSLLFNSSYVGTYFKGLTVTNTGSNMYIDAIAVSYGYTNADISYLTNLVTQERFSFSSCSIPPYNYSGADSLLSGEVGIDLMRGLDDGDKLIVYTGSNNVYVVNVGSWQKEEGREIIDLELNRTLGLNIINTNSNEFIVFYPYSNYISVVTNIFITGALTPDITNGWNFLSLPYDTIKYPSNYGIDATAGDRIYLRGNRIFYNDVLNEWRYGPSTASSNQFYILPSESFWYYHRGTGIVWGIVQ